jgi:hypothetical protein
MATYNPWVALYWLVTGRTVGGLRLASGAAQLDRTTALRLWTEGGAWFSTEDGKKGRIAPGQFADLAALDADYFSVPEEKIKALASVLTIVAGRVVHGDQEFKPLAPPLPAAMPDWSPVRSYGGYQRTIPAPAQTSSCSVHHHGHAPLSHLPVRPEDVRSFWGALGCSCSFF